MISHKFFCYHLLNVKVNYFFDFRAFCAGGDVKACYQSLIDNPNLVCNGKPGVVNSDFFREEYRMNYRIGTSKIPQVSLWKGIVMGGGVGISIHGKYRVATDNTLFAMPETAIGLFPDVGGTYWLPKLPNNYGNYIGLTGVRLHSYDLLHSGIATHFVKQTLLPDLEAALANVGPLSLAHAKVQEILDDFSSRSAKPDPSKSILHKLDSAIRYS